MEWCINELKRTVAIWKKEWYEDGSIWKQNAEFDASAFSQNQKQKEQNMGVESFPPPLAQEHELHQQQQNQANQASTPHQHHHDHNQKKHDCSCSRGEFIQGPTQS